LPHASSSPQHTLPSKFNMPRLHHVVVGAADTVGARDGLKSGTRQPTSDGLSHSAPALVIFPVQHSDAPPGR